MYTPAEFTNIQPYVCYDEHGFITAFGREALIMHNQRQRPGSTLLSYVYGEPSNSYLNLEERVVYSKVDSTATITQPTPGSIVISNLANPSWVTIDFGEPILVDDGELEITLEYDGKYNISITTPSQIDVTHEVEVIRP